MIAGDDIFGLAFLAAGFLPHCLAERVGGVNLHLALAFLADFLSVPFLCHVWPPYESEATGISAWR